MTSRVTVIIPCHNDADTLSETVSSALSQNEAPEIVIVDDGSTDTATLMLLDHLEEENRIRIIHQDNTGPARARTAGARTATTPYIFPLDADDLLLPGVLRLLADTLDAHPEAGVAYGDFRTFGERSQHRRTLPYVCPWLLTYRNTIPGGSLIRREAWLQTTGWKARHHEDWDMWMSLIELGWKGVKVDEDIFLYRLRPGSRFSKSRKNLHANRAIIATHHESLFSQREQNRRASPTPWAVRALLPHVQGLPLSTGRKELLSGLLIGAAERSRLSNLKRVLRSHRRA
jgi:glycosyltransferase involved in cell wall biosynthesis